MLVSKRGDVARRCAATPRDAASSRRLSATNGLLLSSHSTLPSDVNKGNYWQAGPAFAINMLACIVSAGVIFMA